MVVPESECRLSQWTMQMGSVADEGVRTEIFRLYGLFAFSVICCFIVWARCGLVMLILPTIVLIAHMFCTFETFAAFILAWGHELGYGGGVYELATWVSNMHKKEHGLLVMGCVWIVYTVWCVMFTPRKTSHSHAPNNSSNHHSGRKVQKRKRARQGTNHMRRKVYYIRIEGPLTFNCNMNCVNASDSDTEHVCGQWD